MSIKTVHLFPSVIANIAHLNGEARHNHVTVGRNYGHVLEANIVVGRGLDHHSPDDRPAFNYLQLGAVGNNTTVIPEQKFQSKLLQYRRNTGLRFMTKGFDVSSFFRRELTPTVNLIRLPVNTACSLSAYRSTDHLFTLICCILCLG